MFAAYSARYFCVRMLVAVRLMSEQWTDGCAELYLIYDERRASVAVRHLSLVVEGFNREGIEEVAVIKASFIPRH